MWGTIIILIIAALIAFSYNGWKKKHPEIVKAQNEANELEKCMQVAQSWAIHYECQENFDKYKYKLRNDLKAFLFSPANEGVSSGKNQDIIFAIIFYYIGGTPDLLRENNLIEEETKETLINYLIDLGLSKSVVTAPEACRYAIKRCINPQSLFSYEREDATIDEIS